MICLFIGGAKFHRAQIKTKSQDSTEPRPAKLILFAAIFLFSFSMTAQTTNALSGAETKGHELAQKILESKPIANIVQTGTLKIRDENDRTIIAFLKCEIV